MLYDAMNRLEDVLRPLLGLKRKPHHHSLYFGEPDEQGLIPMMFPSEEEEDLEEENWHREPRRGRALNAAVSFIKRLEPLKLYEAPRWAVERRLREHELVGARSLKWNSHHYDTIGVSSHLDGYLTLPSGRQYALDVSSLSYRESWVVESWQSGEVYREGRGTDKDVRVATAVVPAKCLTPSLVRQAIERWYMDRFQYAQGHWSLLEKRLPEFEIDESFWDWPKDLNDRALAEQAAKEAEETVAAIVPQSGIDERTARRYGRLNPSVGEIGPRGRASGLAERAGHDQLSDQ